MQEISSFSVKHKSDRLFHILILQTVTVGIIMLFAAGIRVFGGDIYKTLSEMYHERFDDITTVKEVYDPKNPVSENSSEDKEQNEETQTPPQGDADDSLEEYDAEIDGELSGNIYDVDSVTAVNSNKTAWNVNSFLWPVSGVVSSHYGYRVHPISGEYSMHNGLDIAADKGSDILTAYDGIVTSAGYSNSYGYYLIISHNDTIRTLYAHCSKLLAKEGDSVKKGDKIATVGSTGRSTGPHLHFEVRVGGYRIDPEWLLSDVAEV